MIIASSNQSDWRRQKRQTQVALERLASVAMTRQGKDFVPTVRKGEPPRVIMIAGFDALRPVLTRLGILGHKGLFLRISSQLLDDENYRHYSVSVGSRRSMFHELAHMAEFGPDDFDKRCSDSGSFIFKGSFGPKNGAVDRELRTVAHQFHLMCEAEQMHCYAQQLFLREYTDGLVGFARYCDKEISGADLKRVIAQTSFDEAQRRLVGWLDKVAQRLGGGRYHVGINPSTFDSSVYDGFGQRVFQYVRPKPKRFTMGTHFNRTNQYER
jgi:hypothetical protein